MRTSTLCQFALFGISVEALAFPGPQPTGVIALEDSNGWTPKPTAAPAFHEVLRRQNGRPSNYIAAPDNTCGYVDANRRDPLTCPDSSQQCIFITASGKASAAVGCCGNGGCNIHTACLDRKDLKDCDEDCQADPQILKCSAFAKQLCNTISYEFGAVDYYCSIFRQRNIEEADTTHVGQRGRTMSTITPTSTSTRRTSTASTKSGSSSSRSSDPISSLETETPTTDRSLETGSSSADLAPAATSSDAAAAVPAESSSSNTGAIVGGVIGAIGAIALIAFAFIFIRRRKREQEGQTQIPDGPPQPPMYQQPSSQPPSQPPSQPQMYQQSAPPQQPSTYAQSQATTYQASSYQPSQPSMYEKPQPSTFQQQPPSQPVLVVSPFSDPPRQHQSQSETPSFTSISSSSAASAIPPPLNLSSSTSSPYQQYQHQPVPPAQLSPLSGSTIAALAAVPDTQKSAYHNHPPPEKSPNYYPAPSPMSTPAASPRFSFDGTAQAPQPLQPYRPESAAYPNQPQYQPKQYKPYVPNTAATQEAMDSPISAYNALPVSPVSALGSHPMDDIPVVLATATVGTRRNPSVKRGSGEKGGAVPLVLQPGLGAQRFAPGTVKQVTVQRGMSRRGQNPMSQSPVQQQQGQESNQGQVQGQSPTQPTQAQQQPKPIGEEGEEKQQQQPQAHDQHAQEPNQGLTQEKEPHRIEKVAAAP
ncbi:hypothetical protein B0T21DRAFT_354819 [Apiosordaria backusii]|uniref:Uncharacterized protein n=1 Tax=Apiosordaria backusii TaxID=314023 RepID=A0AA40EY33_9PEZI|nr:hypothetical protein B0T21DRAFT_354819 [Apiosordaria backusii]